MEIFMYNEEKIFKRMMSRIKTSSRKTVIRENGSYSRGRKEELEVKITWQDIQQKYHQQNRLCHWFKIPIDLSHNLIRWHPLAASCDRLDNNAGYTNDNIVIATRFSNLGRGACTEDIFIESLDTIKQALGKDNV